MKKVYKKLTEEQIKRGVIFSSQLCPNGSLFEVFKIDESLFKDKPTYELKRAIDENRETINRLLDDKFFNKSCFVFNEIRR